MWNLCEKGRKVCLHATVFSPPPLLPPLQFSIVPMVTVWIMEEWVPNPFFSVILKTMKRTHLTRMHSSRMRTVRFSGIGKGEGGVCSGVCVSQHALGRWGCLPQLPPPPVDRILNTHLWKHHLSATMLRTVITVVITDWGSSSGSRGGGLRGPRPPRPCENKS